MRAWSTTAAAICLTILTGPSVRAGSGSIRGTPHDLSPVPGGGSCSFCHTPHGALPGTPLWSHKLSTAVYKIYESSSLKAKVGQPTGSSKLCLSCHDGTVALTETLTGRPAARTFPRAAPTWERTYPTITRSALSTPPAYRPRTRKSGRRWGCRRR